MRVDTVSHLALLLEKALQHICYVTSIVYCPLHVRMTLSQSEAVLDGGLQFEYQPCLRKHTKPFVQQGTDVEKPVPLHCAKSAAHFVGWEVSHGPMSSTFVA
jgi:hypothetical protein